MHSPIFTISRNRRDPTIVGLAAGRAGFRFTDRLIGWHDELPLQVFQWSREATRRSWRGHFLWLSSCMSILRHHKARLPELSSSPYQLPPPLFHRFSFSSFPLGDRRTWELAKTRIICIINICHLLSIIVNKCEVWKKKNFLQNPSNPYLNCIYWPYQWKKELRWAWKKDRAYNRASNISVFHLHENLRVGHL